MNTLLINNFYYNRGGDCTYLLSLKKLLESKGHKVSIFSMQHPLNYDSEYSGYFTSYINYAEEIKKINLSSGLNVLLRSIYSSEAKRKMERLLKEEKPDIVHLNNIRQHVTPSILYPIKKNNIPIVWTLHDYQLICPNISFLANGNVCERCKKRKYFWPPLVRCKKNSFLASMMASLEHSIHMITGVYDLVDVFICPSDFLMNKFIQFGFHESKLVCLNYFMDVSWDHNNEGIGEYILYIGRLSEEKGIKTLLDAVARLDSCKLKVVGDGPLREKLVSYTVSKGISGKVEFLGHKGHDEVIGLLKKCKFLIIPSEWYEVAGLVIYEAYACGKTVIGSNMGGIPEFIKNNKTGLIFEPRNVEDLRMKIQYLINNSDRIIEMGEAGRSYLKQELGGETHYRKIMEIYHRAAAACRRKAG